MLHFTHKVINKIFLLKSSTFIRVVYSEYFVVKSSRTMASSFSKRRTVAVCQMTATNNKENNIKTCSELIRSAKEQNCMMVFLPEACDYIGESKTETLSMAEPLSGNLMKTFCRIAKENEIWVSLGGIHEQVTSDKVQNTHVLINSKGDIAATYRKTHLFDVDLVDQGIRLMESDYVLPGKTIVPPVQTPVGNVGLSICYDMRFPEQSLMLAKMGADILTFPSAFTYVTGAAHWETILRARAIESQCYVIAAAQTGAHNKKRTSWGHAMIVDPWGTVVAQCSDGTNIAVAEINLDYVAEVRSSIPVWKHRRNDLYRELTPKKETDNEIICTVNNITINPKSIVYKTTNTVAFACHNRIVPGHLLVVPLRQVKKLSELNSDELCDIFSVVQRIQTAFQACYNISANTVFIKEDSDHLCIHVLPRRPGDFAENDMIYSELDKHEGVHSDSGEVPAETKDLQTYFSTSSQ